MLAMYESTPDNVPRAPASGLGGHNNQNAHE